MPNLGYYHHVRFEALARRLSGVTVVEVCGASEFAEFKLRAAESSHYELMTYHPDLMFEQVATVEVRRIARQTLAKLRPDVVCVPGWSSPLALAALQWCARRATPAIVTSDSQYGDERRVWWKEAIKRATVAAYSAALVAGQSHREYLAMLGMPRERIFQGFDVVDNDHFMRGADAARAAADRTRAALNLPRHFFLASSRFIPKKNLAGVIRAFAAYRQRSGAAAWDLIILGDGPLRGELESLARELKLTDKVQMPGFKAYDELPAYYGLAGALVHASTTEQWGLVVNEALAAGAPVLVSDRCGCAAELVAAGKNGYTFDPNDTPALTNLMSQVSAPDCDRAALGAASRQIVAQWGPDAFASGMIKAIDMAIGSPRRASLFSLAVIAALARFRRSEPPR
jgi:glycosyltransferase involved in cell wall biosynthesis